MKNMNDLLFYIQPVSGHHYIGEMSGWRHSIWKCYVGLLFTGDSNPSLSEFLLNSSLLLIPVAKSVPSYWLLKRQW